MDKPQTQTTTAVERSSYNGRREPTVEVIAYRSLPPAPTGIDPYTPPSLAQPSARRHGVHQTCKSQSGPEEGPPFKSLDNSFVDPYYGLGGLAGIYNNKIQYTTSVTKIRATAPRGEHRKDTE
ncbi:hypothetical protein CBL_01902 [Carabus blaptoides fortunei]